jgi:hypothetical protein
MEAHRLPLSRFGEVMVAIFRATIKELLGDYPRISGIKCDR